MKLGTVYVASAQPAPLAKPVVVEPPPENPSKLESSVASPTQLYVTPLWLAGLQKDWLATAGATAQAAAIPVVQPAPGSAAGKAPPEASPETSGSLKTAYEAAKPGFKSAGKALALVHVTQGMSHAEVLGAINGVGIQGQTAETASQQILNFLHSQAFHAMVFGVAVGAATEGITKAVSPQTSRTRRLQIASVVGVCAAILFFLLVPDQNPFIGKWTMNPSESKYEFGSVPTSETYQISQEGSGLEISDVSVSPEGKQAQVAYHVDPDGKNHPVTDGRFDSVTTTMSRKALQTTYWKSGAVAAGETRVISADQKQMTITAIGRKPGGEFFKNVVVYDRK